MVVRLALLLGIAAVTGCMGGDSEVGSNAAEPVDRATLTQAFRAAGEPLELRLDMAVADPESLVDAIYVPRESGAQEGAFEVSLFEDEDSAASQAESMRPLEFERHKNVVLILPPETEQARRDRLVAVLQSL